MGVHSICGSLPFSPLFRTMSLLPATTNPTLALDEVYLASGVASTCYASPRPRCKLDFAEGSVVDAIEMSPVTPIETQNDDSEKLTRSQPQAKQRTQKTREQIQLAALCWFLYLEGWNDGSNGPLLPRIQEVYGVPFSCFVCRKFLLTMFMFYLGWVCCCIFDFRFRICGQCA
jgi:hypothetical protein